DVILLAQHLLASVCADYGLPPKTLSSEAQQRLLAHDWPGNVRELSNVLERVALLTDGPDVGAEVLELPAGALEESGPAAASLSPSGSLDDAVREHLRATLAQTGWNISRTAAMLGITRNTVRARIEKLGLRPDAAPTRGRRAANGRAGASGPAEPRPSPAAAAPPSSAIRWDSRRVTLLRAVLDWSDKGPALDVIVDKLKSFGARIDELSPTSVGAVFGMDPIEDAPRRAAHAAMAMQNAAARGRDGEPFTVTTAIHVGQVQVGQFGAEIQIDATAKRVEWLVLDPLLAAARPGSIVASSAAVPFLARRFGVERHESGSRVLHYLRGREGRGLGLEGEMAGFVGRRQELELLGSRLASARAGRSQVVGVVGEAGIGKSRLLYEFRQALRGEAVTYVEGHCLSYGTSIPFLPVLEILRAACRIRESDSPAVVTAKLHKSLARVGIDPESALPFLLRFVGIKEGTESLDTYHADGIQVRTTQILRQICLGAARERPLIIAIEDIHWMDASSEALGEMFQSVEGVPLLLIVTYRPGYWPPSLERTHLTQIALQPLGPEDSRSVLGGFLSRERLADPVCERIVSKAEGNPLFLEELARTVREQSGPSEDITVPDTVEEVLRARINRLPDRERRLLQSAAAIGKTVPVEVLAALAGAREEELRLLLNRLRAAEFLYEVGVDGQYTFKHALTHEVAYGGIPPAERREIHARIVAVIEQINPARRAVGQGARVRASRRHQGGRALRPPPGGGLLRAGARDPGPPAARARGHRAGHRPAPGLPQLAARPRRLRAHPRAPAPGGGARDRPRRSAPARPGVRVHEPVLPSHRRAGPGHRVRREGARHRAVAAQLHPVGGGESLPGLGARGDRPLPQGGRHPDPDGGLDTRAPDSPQLERERAPPRLRAQLPGPLPGRAGRVRRGPGPRRGGNHP